MGGTEMRVLAAHAEKLYAGNGYWEDRPGPEGLQGAEILVLDGLGARWRVDHAFDEQLPDGRRRELAVSALEEITFATDGTGARLSAPVSILIAANWDLSGTARVWCVARHRLGDCAALPDSATEKRGDCRSIDGPARACRVMAASMPA
jgi:hypothetical protein